MICSRAWFALMRRNLLYRRRNWLGTLFEMALPIGFVAILVGLKSAFEFDPDTIEPQYFSDQDTRIVMPFTDYVTAIQAKRVCDSSLAITGIPASGWTVPLVKCDYLKCQEAGQDAREFCEYSIVALSGTNEGGLERAADFKEYLLSRYPVLGQPENLPFDFELFQIFDSSAAMDNYVKRSDYGNSGVPKIAMGIVFEGNDNADYSYHLRQNSTNYNDIEQDERPATRTTPDTGRMFDHFAKDDESLCELEGGTPYLGPFEYSCTFQYVYNGVMTFQRLVGDYIIDRTGAEDAGYFVAEAGVRYVQMPTPTYEEEGFFAATADFAPLLVTLGLLYPVAAMIGYIVREKEFRQKELMKMMSVTESDIGHSWFASFYALNFFVATFTSLTANVFYENSSGLVMWVFWQLTFIAITVFSMLIATFSSKATRSVLIGLLIFFGGVFLTIIVDYDTGSGGTISLISLHPVAAFSFGIQEISRLEDLGIGVTGDSISFEDNPSGYNFQGTLNALILDSILWGVLSWYLNRVMKPDYGQALPFTFPFKLSYWFPGRAHAEHIQDEQEVSLEMNHGIPFEPVGENLARQSHSGESIEIRGLQKKFGDKVAVDGLNLSMYSGQITALLGHNGAGKTTTINMLTGAMEPSAGYALVAGKDIRTQLPLIRKNIGICLQHDCIFPNLTVREHIQFFARLKGQYSELSKEEADQEVDQAIRDVALFEKRNTFAKNLSGGMKRKMSVAMAFCGGSKVVLLDEPTSGMDPFSRRFTWNVIRQYRQNRIIILTTHFMDEADILGDRIAIMAEGQLRCAGSSLFLKKTYGVGYQLTIEKTRKRMDDADAKKTNTEDLDSDLEMIVSSAVEEATLLSNVGSEMSYQLPLSTSPKFGPMFDGLDDKVEQGFVSSYGVSVTTLEEVFLLVARGGHTKTDQEIFASSRRLDGDGGTVVNEDQGSRSVRSRMDLSSDSLFSRHVGALFKKRAAVFRRDRKAWCCTTILPSLFVFCGFLLFMFAGNSRDLDPIVLDLDDYNPKASNPRNPIVFNSPDNVFQCRPGSCSYPADSLNISATNETYFFCGNIAQFPDEESSSCSISESGTIVSLINDSGAQGFVAQLDGSNVATIGEVSLSLEASSKNYAASQFGSLIFTHDQLSNLNDGTSYNETVVVACESQLDSSDYADPSVCLRYGGVGFVIVYNFTAAHVTPLYQTLADEAIVRLATNRENFQIRTTIAPLPITQEEENYSEAEDLFSAWFLVVLSFPFCSASFAAFVVAERESKAKHLQTVAGVSPVAYWLSTFFWDILNYQLPMWITVALIFAFDVDALKTTQDNVLSGVIAILFLFGPAAAGFAYCFSFGFKSPSLCSVILIVSGFLVGMGGPLTVLILEILGEDPLNPQPNLAKAANIVSWCLRWVPSFCLGKGIFYAINLQSIKSFEGDPNLSVWSPPVLLWEVVCLLLQTVGYLILAIMLDKWSTNPAIVAFWKRVVGIVTCRCLGRTGGEMQVISVALPEDDDVLEEQERVLRGESSDDLVVIDKLTKIYDNGKIAVNNLSLGIPPGECFGLLGINGAGKTTTLAMLTAEFPPTSGDATLAGFSVTRQPEMTRRRIGYCPQFDAHFANMTGREHVELYASIKGVPIEAVKEAAASKLCEVGLSEKDSDRLSSGYSGGMKRRLSLACATIGQPQLLFLDECSTGVDPVARREIWQMISDIVSANVPSEEKTSVVLTTHSMEECEALCPRIGIMANGRLRCLGSAQHLKNKFGRGYQVEMKINGVERDDDDFLEYRRCLGGTDIEGNTETEERVEGNTEAEEGAAENTEAEEGVAGTYYQGSFTLAQAIESLRSLTNDEYLSSMLNASNPSGYSVWKDATSDSGVSIDELAVFACVELRMRNVDNFFRENYPNHVLRERQESKARYEIDSAGTRISKIFADIESSKAALKLADYGVSQTSLEQVFNFHAAEAEELKQGRNDG